MDKDEISVTGEKRTNPFQEAYDYIMALEGESDRGAAIVAVADFEYWLRHAIIKQFVGLNKTVHDRIWRGPLNNFSAIIDIGFALGLYDHGTLVGLRKVAEVRNKFSHARKSMRFSDVSVSKKCRELKTCQNSEDPRKRYLEYLTQVSLKMFATSIPMAGRRREDDA